jgi:protein TonB
MPVAVLPVPEETNGFLNGCLIEGDAVQQARVRLNQRRALVVSIAVQILLVAALGLFPLFSRGENIANRAVFLPQIPYSPRKMQIHERKPSDPTRGNPVACRFCPPPSIPTTIVTHDHQLSGDANAPTDSEIPAGPEGQNISGLLGSPDSRRGPAPPPTPRAKERLRKSAPVQAAMLIRRIEPVYPPLARQIRREGRVELHAIISTDGTIESLEVLSGDPLFLASALAAVREWRYRPTILDGQPVEVDTHITVVYTLAR